MGGTDKILVVGVGGMLGREVVRLLNNAGRDVVKADLAAGDGQVKIDITDASAVKKLFAEVRPSVVYNCAAFTNVDGAEQHEELAHQVNGDGVGNLARSCLAMGSLLVHVSTDYVFSGDADEPYMPNDDTCPQTAYGRSKLAGEQAMQRVGGQWLLVRTSWLFGKEGGNFVKTILKLAGEKDSLKVVNDQVGCPTYAPDLARCLIDLAAKGACGIYHFCNGPSCSWYDFAKKAVDLAGLDCLVSPCNSSEYPRPAKRPAYSVLDCRATFEVLGRPGRQWPEVLGEYIELNKTDLLGAGKEK
jgi:dTDP-4-dehydrorhamnose reductase